MFATHGALQEELAAALLRSYAGRLAMESGLASDRLASAGPQESTNTAYILRTLQARPLRGPSKARQQCRGLQRNLCLDRLGASQRAFPVPLLLQLSDTGRCHLSLPGWDMESVATSRMGLCPE